VQESWAVAEAMPDRQALSQSLIFSACHYGPVLACVPITESF
jgi:hypothetical protein